MFNYRRRKMSLIEDLSQNPIYKSQGNQSIHWKTILMWLKKEEGRAWFIFW